MPERRELSEEERKQTKISLRLAIFFGCLILVYFLIVSIIWTWADFIAILLFSLLFIVPAYISNASMVLTGGGKPIDGGKTFWDGKRIFGDHKTWNGLIKGPLYIGIPVSIGIFCLFLALWPLIEDFVIISAGQGQYKLYEDVSYYEYYFIGGPLPLGFLALIVRIILCAFGAGIGDLLGSFIKRRFDKESGSFFPIVDQLDFALIAILFVAIPAFIAPTLFWIPDILIIVFLLILTPSVSVIANSIAYMIGLKDVPW